MTDLPVDEQEVGREAEQGGNSGGNRQVALKVVLETHKGESCLSLGVLRAWGRVAFTVPR